MKSTQILSKRSLVPILCALVPVSWATFCYHCNSLKGTKQEPRCPGAAAYNFSSANYCRLLALSDGTIISQSPAAASLCSEKAKLTTKIVISKDFRDGKGIVGCCSDDFCNMNSETVLMNTWQFRKWFKAHKDKEREKLQELQEHLTSHEVKPQGEDEKRGPEKSSSSERRNDWVPVGSNERPDSPHSDGGFISPNQPQKVERPSSYYPHGTKDKWISTSTTPTSPKPTSSSISLKAKPEKEVDRQQQLDRLLIEIMRQRLPEAGYTSEISEEKAGVGNAELIQMLKNLKERFTSAVELSSQEIGDESKFLTDLMTAGTNDSDNGTGVTHQSSRTPQKTETRRQDNGGAEFEDELESGEPDKTEGLGDLLEGEADKALLRRQDPPPKNVAIKPEAASAAWGTILAWVTYWKTAIAVHH